MAKFIRLDDAAEILGISPEELNEMRARNEIRGFRDGSNWKFKPDELERAKAAMEAAGDSELNLAEEPPMDGGDSVLLSERELGESGVLNIGSSTVIGQAADDAAAESDLSLGDEVSLSDIELVGDSMIQGSDVKLASESDVLDSKAEMPAGGDAGSELGIPVEDVSSLDLDLSDELSEPETASGSDDMVVGESDLALADSSLAPGSDDFIGDSSLKLGEAETSSGSGSGSDSGSGSSGGSDVEGGSQIDLSDEEDELVLGGTGSDVIGASDSGISLGDPSDSGLSLESEPLELGGSAVGDESLVLGEDDMIALGDDSDPNAATHLKSEDDFLLTTLESASGDESASGSQVIALDDAGMGFDQSGATLMEPDAGMAMLEEDVAGAEAVGGPATMVGPTAPLTPSAMIQPAVPEAPYSIWNVLSMFVCIMLLCLTGMLMYDVVRQIWSWNGVDPVNSGLMNAIISMFG